MIDNLRIVAYGFWRMTLEEKIAAVSGTVTVVPSKPLTLPDYPATIVKAFPEMADHRRRENQVIADWVRSETTRQG